MELREMHTDLFEGAELTPVPFHPKAIEIYMNRFHKKQKPVPIEGRAHPRHTVGSQVDVRPVDEHLNPTGELFKAMTKDISAGGLGLILTRKIEHAYLAVNLGTTKVLMFVLRNRPTGMFYEIGGRFVARLESPHSGNNPSEQEPTEEQELVESETSS